MGKKGNALSGNEKSVKRLKTRIIIFEFLAIAVIVTGAGLVANYNYNVATSNLGRVLNYIFILFGCLSFIFLSSNYAIELYERKLSKYIDTDKLTSGINYEKFLKDAQVLIEKSETPLAVFYGDILNFKYINDTFGYDIGDKLLMFISQKIKDAVGPAGGLYSRISADHYTVIVPYNDKNEFVESIYSIIDDVCWFEDIQKEHYKPEIYVGIFCSGEDDAEYTISEMIDRANMAQHSVKGSSEYHIAYFTEEIRERVIAEKELERRMETALANGEFKAYFQPKYKVDSGEIVGAEALVRWDSPESGFMSPGKFIPLFEQNGFIINLDQYMFETVCKNIREWLDKGVKVVPISVNVSRLQFYRLDFVKRYTKIKEKYNIPDGLLELEFTESIVFENLDILRKIVLSLKKSGFSCSIDDFGSGYSSLNILKNLPMDTLKLDRLFFINDSDNISRDKALISSVIHMSRALEMKTVAEGIENWAQVAFLKEIGCDVIQGYVYSEPIPHARFQNLLEGNRRKEMPAEFRRKGNPDSVLTPENSLNKYGALVGMLEGVLAEVDFNSGRYELLSVLDGDWKLDNIKAKDNEYDDVLDEFVSKYVHPDDVKSVLARCAKVAVMSSFYRKETKIITELRIKIKGTETYQWSKLTIVRIDADKEHNDFRGFFYIESSRTKTLEEQTLLNDTIRNVASNLCSLIYEFNIENKTFKRLYCDTELLGEQPEEGDMAWLHECYLPKRLPKDTLAKLQKLTDPKGIYAFMDDERKTLMTTATTLKIHGEEKAVQIVIAKIKPSGNADIKDRLVVILNVER